MFPNALKFFPLALVATVALAATGCAVDPTTEGGDDEPSIGGTDSGEDGDRLDAKFHPGAGISGA